MTNYREILRLHSLGLNKTEIASSCQCARNTVAATLQRAANCGLQWPLPEEMSDKQLSERLFPTSPSKPVYKMPDYAYVHKELQRSGVTLNLLWLEYCDQCRAAGEIPYQSTQFNKYYADYLAKVNATMHLNHKPGEVMQVDWAGDTATVIDTDILPQNQLYLRFGENVRALRREKHLSQEELSEMVFTTQKYISCIEMGRAHPSLEACLRIADALHVSIDTLLKGIIETGSEVLKPNSPEQDLLDNVIWVVHRYLENR